MTSCMMETNNMTSSCSSNLSGSRDLGDLDWTTPPDHEIYFTYIYRVIYAVGLVGNAFALVVWTRSRLRSSPVTYFQAICVADSLVLLMHPLEHVHAVHIAGLCQLMHVLFLAVQVFAILLVLGLSLQRYIELCHPLTADALITHKRTVVTILLLALTAVLASLMEAYIWHVHEFHASDDASGRHDVIYHHDNTNTGFINTLHDVIKLHNDSSHNNASRGDEDRRDVIVVRQCHLRHATSPRFLWTYATLVLSVLFVTPLLLVVLFNVLVARRIKHKRRNSYAFSNQMVPSKHTMNLSVTFISLYLAVCEIVYAAIHISHYFVLDGSPSGDGADANTKGDLHLNVNAGVLSSLQSHSGSGGGGDQLSSSSSSSSSATYHSSSHSFSSSSAAASWNRSDMPLTGRWRSYYIDSLTLMIVDVIALTSYAIDVTVFTLCSKTFRRNIRKLFHRYQERRSSLKMKYRQRHRSRVPLQPAD